MFGGALMASSSPRKTMTDSPPMQAEQLTDVVAAHGEGPV